MMHSNSDSVVSAFKDIPPAVPPIYRMSRANRPIRLYNGEIELTHAGGKVSQLDGHAYLEWLPSPSFKLHVTYDDPELMGLALTGVEVSARLVGTGMQGSALCAGTTLPSNAPATMSFHWHPDRFVTGGACREIVFHVVNLKDYIGRGARYGRSRLVAGRLEFTFDEWRITLDRASYHDKVIKELKGTGGYGLTHVGRLEHMSAQSFDPQQGFDILDTFVGFLCFCQGRSVGIPLSVGLDQSGKTSALIWANHSTAPWSSVLSWFRDVHAAEIDSLFQGYWDLWQDQFWRDTLREVVYWYVNANRNPAALEEAVVISQIALERLAWASMVENDQVLSMDGFKKLAFADTLGLFLDRLGIPLSIPTGLTELSAYAKASNYKDIPRAIVSIRNDIVHPSRKGLPPGVIWDAWRASLWCLELAILRLLKYDGKYANRTAHLTAVPYSAVESVPWTP